MQVKEKEWNSEWERCAREIKCIAVSLLIRIVLYDFYQYFYIFAAETLVCYYFLGQILSLNK